MEGWVQLHQATGVAVVPIRSPTRELEAVQLLAMAAAEAEAPAGLYQEVMAVLALPVTLAVLEVRRSTEAVREVMEVTIAPANKVRVLPWARGAALEGLQLGEVILRSELLDRLRLRM
jgi:hypothetical protein